jgi:hypothetical protein
MMVGFIASLAFAVLIASAQGTVPKGLTTFFDAEACPTGWSELATSKGRLVVSVAEGSHAGITVNSPINGTQEPTHTHSYSAQASLPEKDVAAIDCCNDQGAHHADYKVAGNLNPSASGHPFVTMVLCTIAEEDTGGSVPFGTIAYFDPIVETCPSGWGSVESLKGRVIVPAYTSAGGQRFSSNPALSSGEDRKHAHNYTAAFTSTSVSYEGVEGCCNHNTAAAGEVVVSGESSETTENIPYVQLLTCESQAPTFNSSGLPEGSMLFNTVSCPPGWNVSFDLSGRFPVSLPYNARPGSSFGSGTSLPQDASAVPSHAHSWQDSIKAPSTGVGLASGCCGHGYAAAAQYNFAGNASQESTGMPYVMMALCKRVASSAAHLQEKVRLI